MGNCDNCRFCKEYKIHKRIINYHPNDFVGEKGITHHIRNIGTVYVGWDFTEYEDIRICERLKCEPNDDAGCELWETEDEG